MDVPLLHQVQQTPRRRHQHMGTAIERTNLGALFDAAKNQCDLQFQIAPVDLKAIANLNRQLARRRKHQRQWAIRYRPFVQTA